MHPNDPSLRNPPLPAHKQNRDESGGTHAGTLAHKQPPLTTTCTPPPLRIGKRDTSTLLLAACAYAVRTDSGWKGKSPIQPAFVSPPFSLDPTPPTAAGIDPTQEGGGSIELMILHPHSHPNPPSLFLGWGKNVKAAFLFFPFTPRSGHNKREEEEEEEADSLEDCSQIDWRCATV